MKPRFVFNYKSPIINCTSLRLYVWARGLKKRHELNWPHLLKNPIWALLECKLLNSDELVLLPGCNFGAWALDVLFLHIWVISVHFFKRWPEGCQHIYLVWLFCLFNSTNFKKCMNIFLLLQYKYRIVC